VHDSDDHEVSCSTADTLVVCVGNGLAGDDAVGEAVYQRLAGTKLPGGIRTVFLGLGGLSILEYLHGQDLLIVVDAVQLGGEPGYVHVMETGQIPELHGQAVSLHGIGLLETLAISRMLYPESAPKRAVLIGIEGRNYNQLGAPMSREVSAAVERAVDEVRLQISRSRREES
jgi:hydrogenase maturation protease